jgi:Domain of unknown function (DUF6249)
VNPPEGVVASKAVNRPPWPGKEQRDMEINEMFVALGVPLGAFFMVVAIVALVGYFKHQATRQRAELIRIALEKGQPLPAQLLDAPGPARNDLANGIRTIFAGVGVGLFLWFIKPERALWALGLMVVLIGLGQLVAHAATTRKAPASPGGPAA